MNSLISGRRRTVAGLGALTGAVLVSLLAWGGAPAQAQGSAGLARTGTATAVTQPIRIVQANLESPQPLSGFLADAQTVIAQQPDFVTYNEVAYRPDSALAPAGYSMFRTPGKYTGENPIAWKTSAWTALATGTWMISDSTAKTAAQKVQLGMRYASWATLQSTTTGAVVSVISAHMPPKAYPVTDLLRGAVDRVGQLVDQLAPAGPVLIGGDFNMHYRGQRYTPDILQTYGLTPTFDLAGYAMPTHDAGGIIDYVFMHPVSAFTLTDQYTLDLNSDHKLLGADLTVTTTPASTVAGSTAPLGSVARAIVVNRRNPTPGTVTARVINLIDGTTPGTAIRLASRRLGGVSLVHALLRAQARGVSVQVVTGDRTPTWAEQTLAQKLGTKLTAMSWATNQPTAYTTAGLPPAAVLFSATQGTPAVRVLVNRQLTSFYQRHKSTAWVNNRHAAYAKTFGQFYAAVGRTF